MRSLLSEPGVHFRHTSHVEYADVPITDLMLDVQNPRHDPASGQREAIQSLLSEGGEKLVHLAEDIVKEGMSPIDVLLVIKATSPSSYTVLEGNRRVAAVKILTNPELASSHPRLRTRFRQLAKEGHAPYSMRVAIASTREEAKHWQELRHTGERGGRGTVPWSAEAGHRFAGRRGSHVERGLVFAEAVAKAYPSNANLQKDLADVRKNRLTTLGRLVSDPSVRDRFGIRLEGGEVMSHHPAAALEPAISRVLHDLSHSVTVTELKTKSQRQKYLGKVADALPSGVTYMADVVPLTATKKARAARKKKAKELAAAGAATKKLFEGVELANLGDRVAGLLKELKELDVDRYPNASAALIRVLLELAVYQVYEAKNRPLPAKLADGIKYCLTQIDPTGKAAKYQPVRTGLQDGTSLLAMKTIHAFLHNPHFVPTSDLVRGIAANYSAFLQELDSLV